MKIIVCLAVAFASATTVAQNAPPPLTAQVALDNVQKYYAGAKQLTAQFRQTVTNATFKTTTKSDGALWALRPDKLRFDYYEKKGSAIRVSRTFIFDGQSLWLIDHDNRQIVQSQPQQSSLPAAVSFLTGAGILAAQFAIALDTTGTYGGKGDVVLELTPKQPSAYAKLFFVVDPAKWNVKQSIVIDAGGDTSSFTFYAPNVTGNVQTHFFMVNPAKLPTYKHVQPTSASSGSGTGSSSAPTP